MVIGVVLSIFVGRFNETALGEAKLEPILVAVVAAALLITAIAAAAMPSQRASRIDPQKALRQD